MDERKMFPVVKWAGGKTQLLKPIAARMPRAYNTYYEPFLGGGAVLLSAAPPRAHISDINAQLMNLYRQIKAAPDDVIEAVRRMDAEPCTKEKYYELRAAYNQKIARHCLDTECAALMVWLNKHCFNGLYRVNSKGLFNVPYNNRTTGNSVNEQNIRAVSAYLRQTGVSMDCVDFEEACSAVGPGDFVYFDSPYVPAGGGANFTSYTTDGFMTEDHLRLAALFKRLDRAGALLMLSNNDVPLVRTLYAGYNIQALAAKRMINRSADGRTGQEVLITNY